MDSHCSVPLFECQTPEGDTMVQQPHSVRAVRVLLLSAVGPYGFRLRWLSANNNFMKVFQQIVFFWHLQQVFILILWSSDDANLWGVHCKSSAFFLRSRQGEMRFLWSQAIDCERGAWASLKWGGLLYLKVDQTQKYSGDDNKMSLRHVKISVCPAFVVLRHFFFPSHLFFSLQWATRF